VDNTSYIRGDGKRAYRYVDASHQSSLLNYIVKSFQGYSGKLPAYLKKVKGKLITSSPLLGNNIFITGTNQIVDYASHDSMKTRGKDQFATYLHAEKASDYFKRTFIYGFLSRMKSSKKAQTYIQFLPIPSNRRTIDGVEVKFLQKDDLFNAFVESIKGEKNRLNFKPGEFTKDSNYAKRWNKHHFPGLEGVKVDRTTSSDKLATQAIVELRKRAKEYFAEMISGDNRIYFDQFTIEHVNSVLGNKVKMSSVSKFDADKMALYMERKRLVKGKADPTEIAAINKKIEAKLAERAAQIEEAAAKAFEEFYLNSVVNQYNLSQLIYGDESFFKHKEDETKRIQVATATGDTLLVDPTYGMLPTSRVGVIRDIEPFVPENLDYVRDEAFREEYNLADGQGYILPEAYERMARAAGMDAAADVTLKPVYYGLDEMGRPVALKYSLIVLTDELLSDPRNAYLRDLREDMRNYNRRNPNAPMEQAVFESAVKLGKPQVEGKVPNFIDDNGRLSYSDGVETRTGFSPDSVMEIDNNLLRIQLNPAKKVEASVANPSQGTAFMNSNGLNEVESSYLHRLQSIMISLGDKGISRELRLTSKGTLSNSSKKMLRQRIAKMEDIPGMEDVARLAGSKNNQKRYDVSLSVPLIADRVVSSISSIFSSSTVGFRFPGSKLVLQSEFGTYTAQSEALKWKDSEGYTEVLLPEEFRTHLQTGDVITDGLVGFRIPSTNYHSLLALKVKGFYKVPPGSKGNVIIAPSLIVYYHGSDYDIDTLFVIKKKRYKPKQALESISDILNRQKLIYPKKGDAALEYEEGDVLGFKTDKRNGDQFTLRGRKVSLAEFLFANVKVLSSRIEDASRELTSETTGKDRDSKQLKLKVMTKDLATLVELAEESALNAMVHIFSSNLRAEKNRSDLLTPITFGRVSALKSDIQNKLNDLVKTPEFIKELEEAGLIKRCK
jgi:hypothetical protein